MSAVLEPTIINPKSRFVVITYWWGRGRENKNTQRPCPEDSPTKITRKPITYDAMIDRWTLSCEKYECNHLAKEYPEFARPGGYQDAINFKPDFIKQALKACHPRGVLYIDGDMLIKRYPLMFDIPNIDFMCRGWNTDPRSAGDITDTCFDPYIFETSGGTIFFGNTPNAFSILDLWIESTGMKKNKGKADDRILSLYFNNKLGLLTNTVIQLPVEYLWLTLDYNSEIPTTRPYEYYIEHPECLTGEDRAQSYGSSSNRIPLHYDDLITDQVKCRRGHKLKMYEFITFPSKRYITTETAYIRFLKENSILDIIPFDSRFGEYNTTVAENLRVAQTLTMGFTGTVKITTPSSASKRTATDTLVVPRSELIPSIVACLKKGIDVIYIPPGSKGRYSKIVDIRKKSNTIIDFMAHNTNTSTRRFKKEYILKLDDKYPVFFSSDNTVLFHLVCMCKTLRSLSKIFNESYDFLSRIRCKWY